MKGDFNKDDKITLADVNYLLNYIAGKEGYSVSLFDGDLNGNGKIELADVSYLLNYIAGKPGYEIKNTGAYMYSLNLSLNEILITNFDYIVIGGGGSGCTAAYTLANNSNNKILLIEAGQLRDPDNSGGLGFRHNGFQISKNIGGGTLYNARAYRGLSKDYIEDINIDNYTKNLFYEANIWCNDFFAKPWHYDFGSTKSNSNFTNLSSKLSNNWSTPNINPKAYMENTGAQSINYKSLVNQNVAVNEQNKNIYLGELGISDTRGKRTSGAFLLNNNISNNLNILAETFVEKIIFDDNNNPIELSIYNNSQNYILKLNNTKLLLTGGVYQSPVLLQSSGYGPENILKPLNIDILKNIPNNANEQCGNNYWNNLYINRLFELPSLVSYNLRTNTTVGDTSISSDRLYFYLKKEFNNTKVSIRADQTLSNGRMVGYFDLEQSSKLEKGGYVYVNDNLGNIDFRPDISYQYVENADNVTKVIIDTTQAYFFEIYYPLMKNEANLNNSQIVNKFINGNFTILKSKILSDLNNNTNLENSYKWVDDSNFFNKYKTVLLNEVQNRNGDLDSIHYGGTTAYCIDNNFKVIGLNNVYVADLSVFKDNMPGNSMGAAYVIGRVVANKLLNYQPKFNSSDEYYNDYLYKKNNYYLNYFSNKINQENFKLLLLPDCTNIKDDFYYELLNNHRFGYDNNELALAGVTGSKSYNEFLITKKEYKNFELVFQVKLEDPQLNSGIQILSSYTYSNNRIILRGPQIEIDSSDFGGIWDENNLNKWLYSPKTITSENIWKDNDFNTYEIKCNHTDNLTNITVKINDVLVTDFNDKINLPTSIYNYRLAFQVHSYYNIEQIGKKIWFKNILIKEL